MLSERPREVLPLNGADNWLHFGVGIVMVALGLTLAASRVPTGAEGEVLVPSELRGLRGSTGQCRRECRVR